MDWIGSAKMDPCSTPRALHVKYDVHSGQKGAIAMLQLYLNSLTA